MYQLSVDTHTIERCPPWSCVVRHGRALSAVMRCPLWSCVVRCPPLCVVCCGRASCIVHRRSSPVRRCLSMVAHRSPPVAPPPITCRRSLVTDQTSTEPRTCRPSERRPSEHPSIVCRASTIRVSSVDCRPSESRACTIRASSRPSSVDHRALTIQASSVNHPSIYNIQVYSRSFKSWNIYKGNYQSSHCRTPQ